MLFLFAKSLVWSFLIRLHSSLLYYIIQPCYRFTGLLVPLTFSTSPDLYSFTESKVLRPNLLISLLDIKKSSLILSYSLRVPKHFWTGMVGRKRKKCTSDRTFYVPCATDFNTSLWITLDFNTSWPYYLFMFLQCKLSSFTLRTKNCVFLVVRFSGPIQRDQSSFVLRHTQRSQTHTHRDPPPWHHSVSLFKVTTIP